MEIGTDSRLPGPSPRRFSVLITMTMNQSSRKMANWPRLWKSVRIGMCVFIILLVYAFSIGPVMKMYGVKNATDVAHLPALLRVIYYPLLNSKIECLNAIMDHYVQLWLN